MTVKHKETNLSSLQSLSEQDQYKGTVVKEKPPTNPLPAKDQQPARQQATKLRTTNPHKQRNALIPRAGELQVQTEDYKVV